jgi:phosphatidate cytidylyltransferase
MKRVLTALVLVPVVLLLVFLGPRWQWLFTLATAGVACLAAWEFLGLADRVGAKPSRIAVLGCIAALFAARLFADAFEFFRQSEAIFGALALILLIYCAFRSPVQRMMADASSSIFCLFYVGFTLTTLAALHEDTEVSGATLVTFLLCVVWAGDIAALYVGRAWGRHKLAPKLSPNKSWEGAIASIAGSLLALAGLMELSTLLAGWNIERLSFHSDAWPWWVALAVLVNVAAQVGDLVESALKRSAGVKDSGSLLPGHGGVLDRIDALLLAAPVLWYAQVFHQRF